ncbi:hypothetical protein [Streptomyces xantholiticus]|uniref:hypothetical protein n=1 Tax=Streptomyces xantholiticus TaxID=68285 RepID=UPI001E4B2321|nr:hypothetical protein [Streptomyces xantholiticus]
MTLNKDGSFTTAGWPIDLESATGDPERTGNGTWELTPADSSDWPVSFSFREISGYWDSETEGGNYGSGVYVGGSREKPHLYEFVGDPDVCDLITFTRTD